MDWTRTESNENLLYRHVTPDQRVELGIYPVMYGFRVRAGWNGSVCCQWDWCCGAEDPVIREGFSIAKKLLWERRDDENPFFGIPTYSEIKPYPKDPKFSIAIRSLAGQFEIDPNIPSALELRKEFIESRDLGWLSQFYQ